ncbi:MAG: sigma-54-dependent Fis family transcriptional regulator [Deltaproteobacteria bacterium]|nr:sigma-54-dependent Fis family transcriptional regulator [Deltaproteobacteria bacterium]
MTTGNTGSSIMRTSATSVDSSQGSVLVVDDDPDMRNLLRAYLTGAGFEVLEAGTPDAASEILEEAEDVVDATLLDVMLPQRDGIELLRALKPKRPHMSFVMVTGSSDVLHAVAAMKAGAMDYLLKPVEKTALLQVAARAVGASRAARELAARRALEPAPLGDGDAVFSGAAVQRVLSLVEHVKDTSVPILILGESGSGKEVLARFIHRRSKRRDQPFVTVNCAALPRELVESELFGHEKGAFTGAGTRHRGRFEEAADGTILLDEVGELDAGVQAKFLRVLQERELTRVGGGSVKTNARVLVATNRNLLAEVEAGRFRLDLYYRLEVITVTLPPLRERAEEIGPLAAHLLERFAATEGVPLKTISADAVALLMRQPWPGNIRELENLLKRSALMATGAVLHARDLLLSPATGTAAPAVPPTAATAPEPRAPHEDEPVRKLSEYEPDLMMRALAASHGDVAEAARRLGIGRATFYRRAKRHGIPL